MSDPSLHFSLLFLPVPPHLPKIQPLTLVQPVESLVGVTVTLAALLVLALPILVGVWHVLRLKTTKKVSFDTSLNTTHTLLSRPPSHFAWSGPIVPLVVKAVVYGESTEPEDQSPASAAVENDRLLYPQRFLNWAMHLLSVATRKATRSNTELLKLRLHNIHHR